MAPSDPVPRLDPRFSDPEAGPTPWPDVRRVLADAELFWITTLRRDGRPHATPLTAVWHDDTLHFCTGAEEQKGVNLAHDPRCLLTTGTNVWQSGLDVVVEGRAERVTDDDRLRALARMWETKYSGDWHFDVADGAFRHEAGEAIVFAVAADKVLAFAKGESAQTAFHF